MEKWSLIYRDLQRYIAVTTIGPSSLRNQGSAGVIKVARNYLADIDLGAFRTKEDRDSKYLIINTILADPPKNADIMHLSIPDVKIIFYKS